jgi:hypothetical protein
VVIYAFNSFASFWRPTLEIDTAEPLDPSTLPSVAHQPLGAHRLHTIDRQVPNLTVYEHPLRHDTYEFRVQTLSDIVVPSATKSLRRVLGLKRQITTTTRDTVLCCFRLDLSAPDPVWCSLRTVVLRERVRRTRLTFAGYCLDSAWGWNRVVDGLVQRKHEEDVGPRGITMSSGRGTAVYLAPYSHAVVFKKPDSLTISYYL